MAINKNKVIAAAQKYVQKGQLDKAIREYQRVVEAEPTDVRTWLKIGDLQAKKGSPEEATATYLRVANHYSEQGFFLKAVAVFKQVLKIEPRHVEVHLKLAALYKQLGLVTDARRQLEAAYQVLAQLGRAEDSLQVLHAMVELDPENVAVRIRIAETFSKEKKVDEAVAEFTRAADVLRASGRIDDFLRVAERLLWHRSDNVPFIKEVATLYLRQGDPRRALQKLQVCYKADEKDTETMNLLVNAFLALEQPEKAVTILKVLASVHEEKGELDHRDDVFRRILILAPTDQEARDAMREATGVSAVAVPPSAYEPVSAAPAPAPAPAPVEPEPPEEDEAEMIEDIAELDAFEELGEDDETAGQIATLYGEAEVFEKFGLLREALEQLERAKQLEPDNLDTQIRLKELYVKVGRTADAVAAILVVAASRIASDPTEAERLLREALELDPSSRRAKEMLADIPGVEPPRRPRTRRSSINLASRWQRAESDAQIMDDIAAEAYTGEPTFATQEIDIDALERELEDAEPAGPAKFRPVMTEPSAYGKLGAELEGEDDAYGEVGLEYLEEQLDADALGAEDDLLLDPLLAGRVAPTPSEDEIEVDLAGVADGLGPKGDSERGRVVDPWDAEAEEVSLELDLSAEEEGHRADTAVVSQDRIERIAAELDAAEDDEPLDLDRDLDGMGFASDDLFQDELRQLEEAERLVASLTSDELPAAPRPRKGAATPAAYGTEEAFADLATPPPEEEAWDAPSGEAPAGADARPAGEELEVSLGDLAEDLAAPELAAGPPAFAPALTEPGEPPAPPVPEWEAEEALEAPPEPELAAEPELPVEIEVPEDLAEEMAEADFFIDQGLLEDAISMLRDLVEEHGEHPALMAKIARLTAQLADEGDSLDSLGDDLEDALGDLEAPPEAEAPRGGRLNIPRKEADAFHQFKEGVAKQVGENDADTHFDVGIAYREMGMVRDAIGEFQAAMRPHNEVQCHLMIAQCHRDLGEPSESINVYKKALYCDQITEAEQVDIYYQMGQTYEALQDPREALYYYEKVSRIVVDYRDVEARLSTLRAGLDPTRAPNQKDVDTAFDDLLGLPTTGADER